MTCYCRVFSTSYIFRSGIDHHAYCLSFRFSSVSPNTTIDRLLRVARLGPRRITTFTPDRLHQLIALTRRHPIVDITLSTTIIALPELLTAILPVIRSLPTTSTRLTKNAPPPAEHKPANTLQSIGKYRLARGDTSKDVSFFRDALRTE
jgi:hypothetical protein